jgi:hypothetical protein
MPATLEQLDLGFREVSGGLEYDAPSRGRVVPMRLYDGIEPTAQVRQLLHAAMRLRDAADPQAFDALRAEVAAAKMECAAEVERMRLKAISDAEQARAEHEEEMDGVAALLAEATTQNGVDGVKIAELQVKIASMEAAVAETDDLKAKLKDSDFHRDRLSRRNAELEEDLARLRSKRR